MTDILSSSMESINWFESNQLENIFKKKKNIQWLFQIARKLFKGSAAESWRRRSARWPSRHELGRNAQRGARELFGQTVYRGCNWVLFYVVQIIRYHDTTWLRSQCARTYVAPNYMKQWFWRPCLVLRDSIFCAVFFFCSLFWRQDSAHGWTESPTNHRTLNGCRENMCHSVNW